MLAALVIFDFAKTCPQVDLIGLAILFIWKCVAAICGYKCWFLPSGEAIKVVLDYVGVLFLWSSVIGGDPRRIHF